MALTFGNCSLRVVGRTLAVPVGHIGKGRRLEGEMFPALYPFAVECAVAVCHACC